MAKRKVESHVEWKEVVEADFRWPGQDGSERAGQDGVLARPGNDGIRNLGRRPRRHRDSRHNGVPAQARGAVDRHIGWYQQLVERFGFGQGRATDEHFKRALMGLSAGSAMMGGPTPGRGPRLRGGWVALRDERGQSTVEFAVVMAAGLAIVVALGALSNAAESGLFVRHAVMAASHSLGGMLGGAADVFSY